MPDLTTMVPVANRGSAVRSFTPSKPGYGLRAFADNALVTVESPAGNALTAVASTLLNAKAVHLEGASLTPKQVHAFCDHVDAVDGPLVNHGDRPALYDLQSHGARACR